ncbi:MAG: PIN domain-containing protein [Oscillospiraceae bacterium]|nr:PIN domain-containing protein [Oscillospiraceae bacterium]
MKALIDTNVLIDVFAKREPHLEASAAVLRLCGAKLTGSILVSQTTDIYYILRREGISAESVKEILKTLAGNMILLDVNANDAKNAIESDMSDYEDALLAFRAKRANMNVIITRNLKDFVNSPVSAITPIDFLSRYGYSR